MTLDELIERQIDLLRFDAGVRREVITMLEGMADEVARIIGRGEITRWGAERLKSLLQGVMDVVGTTYTNVITEFAERMIGLSQSEAAYTSRTLGVDITPKLPTQAVLKAAATDSIVLGASSRDWWKRQSGDAQFRFKAAIRQGIVQGETIPQIVRRIRGEGKGDLSELTMLKRNATTLVRSSVMTVHAAARLETLKANDDVVVGVMQLSTLDDRTTDICIAYDGQKWDLKGNPIRGSTLPFKGGPPRHWNCRSGLIPITKTYRELGVDIDEKPLVRSSDVGPTTATFAGWLATKDAAYQNKLLGKGKAELWRAGKISLQQLLDQTGRPLTLKQLRERS